jgi:methionyl-tRNA formyltransferase
MRLVFAGTPDFAVPALEALASAGHEVAAVLTQPDRPAGRGRQLTASPVALRAQQRGLPALKPERLDESAQAQLRALAPDVMVVVAYGLILPPAVLEIPRHGCLNIHASLLPRWRGAAPIQRAILAGDTETGVTIMQMDAGLDTGPMLLQEKIPIGETDTAGDLHDRLAPLGAKLIVDTLAALQQRSLRAQAQPDKGVTYAAKISKDEARLDWSRSATELACCVRAYNPVPIAWAELDGERIRIHRVHAVPDTAADAPGTIQAGADGITVATGEGRLQIEALQRPGGRVLPAREALAGWKLDGRRFT